MIQYAYCFIIIFFCSLRSAPTHTIRSLPCSGWAPTKWKHYALPVLPPHNIREWNMLLRSCGVYPIYFSLPHIGLMPNKIFYSRFPYIFSCTGSYFHRKTCLKMGGCTALRRWSRWHMFQVSCLFPKNLWNEALLYQQCFIFLPSCGPRKSVILYLPGKTAPKISARHHTQ